MLIKYQQTVFEINIINYENSWNIKKENSKVIVKLNKKNVKYFIRSNNINFKTSTKLNK